MCLHSRAEGRRGGCTSREGDAEKAAHAWTKARVRHATSIGSLLLMMPGPRVPKTMSCVQSQIFITSTTARETHQVPRHCLPRFDIVVGGWNQPQRRHEGTRQYKTAQRQTTASQRSSVSAHTSHATNDEESRLYRGHSGASARACTGSMRTYIYDKRERTLACNSVKLGQAPRRTPPSANTSASLCLPPAAEQRPSHAK